METSENYVPPPPTAATQFMYCTGPQPPPYRWVAVPPSRPLMLHPASVGHLVHRAANGNAGVWGGSYPNAGGAATMMTRMPNMLVPDPRVPSLGSGRALQGRPSQLEGYPVRDISGFSAPGMGLVAPPSARGPWQPPAAYDDGSWYVPAANQAEEPTRSSPQFPSAQSWRGSAGEAAATMTDSSSCRRGRDPLTRTEAAESEARMRHPSPLPYPWWLQGTFATMNTNAPTTRQTLPANRVVSSTESAAAPHRRHPLLFPPPPPPPPSPGPPSLLLLPPPRSVDSPRFPTEFAAPHGGAINEVNEDNRTNKPHPIPSPRLLPAEIKSDSNMSMTTMTTPRMGEHTHSYAAAGSDRYSSATDDFSTSGGGAALNDMATRQPFAEATRMSSGREASRVAEWEPLEIHHVSNMFAHARVCVSVGVPASVHGPTVCVHCTREIARVIMIIMASCSQVLACTVVHTPSAVTKARRGYAYSRGYGYRCCRMYPTGTTAAASTACALPVQVLLLLRAPRKCTPHCFC
eukprot:GHVU01078201.1.p1 GENE.GHVU01078201.1~~GHVU01078201.1.p1  ORF type:complete len:519 (-),score=53.31 GHVU01078201.1:149-1705(-)